MISMRILGLLFALTVLRSDGIRMKLTGESNPWMGDNEQWKFYCPFCDTTIESASRHAGSSQHLSWYRNKDNAEWNKKHPKCARELFGMRTKAAKDSVGTKDEGKLWDDVIIKLVCPEC
eukprot:GHVN01083753.1.p1 GENE.GHVN01083753.1~~GHVN01083753.1.p1  ORF type:complete len:119 (-),score=16.39 GHVN01083753.1:160-516(-)